jgi:hypothetical protein
MRRDKDDRRLGPALAQAADCCSGVGRVVPGPEVRENDRRIEYAARDDGLDDRLEADVPEQLDKQPTFIWISCDDHCFPHAAMKSHDHREVKM